MVRALEWDIFTKEEYIKESLSEVHTDNWLLASEIEYVKESWKEDKERQIQEGETLKANNLRILKDGEILKSKACMMVSKSSIKKINLKKIIKLLSKN